MKIEIPKIIFNEAAITEVAVMPSKGIKINPAAIGPRKEPNEFHAYSFPASFPI